MQPHPKLTDSTTNRNAKLAIGAHKQEQCPFKEAEYFKFMVANLTFGPIINLRLDCLVKIMASSRMQRWCLKSAYDYVLEFRAGILNGNADG